MYFFYYFPVGINANLRRFPIMTAVYSALCVAIFIVARFFPSGVGFDVYNLIYMPEDPRIVTAIGAGFLHFGYFHLFGNLLYLIVQKFAAVVTRGASITGRRLIEEIDATQQFLVSWVGAQRFPIWIGLQ